MSEDKEKKVKDSKIDFTAPTNKKIVLVDGIEVVSILGEEENQYLCRLIDGTKRLVSKELFIEEE